MKKSMKMKIDDGTGWANWAWRSAQLAKMPAIATLHAPYTPYTNDELRTLNATQSLIDAQAKLAASFGVNVIWVCTAPMLLCAGAMCVPAVRDLLCP